MGETIFDGSFGNTEYYGGNARALLHSILYQLFRLPEETVLYPGHTGPTTVGQEKLRVGLELS